MKKFITKIILFSLAFFACTEIVSFFFIDKIYFYSINTYNETTTHSSEQNDTKQVDYLFIGSSRVPATINTKLMKKLSQGKTVVNAGRGYTTVGIHYQAIKNKLKKHPDYLRNATVIIEYPGSGIYTNSFSEDKLRVYESNIENEKSMPHLLVPYLDFNSFINFLFESKNSLSTKKEMILIYCSATYRSYQYINEKFHSLNAKRIKRADKNNLASEGGIRNDIIAVTKQKAISYAKEQKQNILNTPFLTFEAMEKSSLAKLHNLITKNGGKLLLYEMPLHSLQKNVHNTIKAKQNKEIFEKWLKNKKIPVIYNRKFKYNDSHFPDTWHLSKNRRDEFTTLLYEEIIKIEYHKLNIRTHPPS
ncbi:MAG: hypothetical protein ACLGGV_00820 [Bacteroidia bacterium]